MDGESSRFLLYMCTCILGIRTSAMTLLRGLLRSMMFIAVARAFVTKPSTIQAVRLAGANLSQAATPQLEVSISHAGLSRDKAYITDPWDHGILFSVSISQVLHDTYSGLQRVQVVSTPSLGRMLVLDGALQCAEKDEAGYHEFITHVPLCRTGAARGGSKRALVIGGGDGGAARELLRHSDIAEVQLIDIDPEVMRVSKELLPSIWRHPNSTLTNYLGLDADPRLKVTAGDGHAFVTQECRGMSEEYDIIVVDASDPTGPGTVLYSSEFYGALKRLLRPGGAVAVQGGSFWYLPMVFRTVFHGLSAVFPVVKPYQCFTAVYPGGIWNIQVATLGDDPSQVDEEKANQLVVESPGLAAMTQLGIAYLVQLGLTWHDTDLTSELAKPPPTVEEASSNLEAIMQQGEGEGLAAWEGLETWSEPIQEAITKLLDESEHGEEPIACFDADGTLWEADVAEVMLEWMREKGHWEGKHGDFHGRYYELLADGNKPAAYGYAAQLFEGMHIEAVRSLTEQCFAERAETTIFPEMKSLITELKARGWRVIIVTASPTWIVEPGARRLGISKEDILGVEVEVEEGILATDKLKHPLPWREGKVENIRAMLAREKLGHLAPALVAGNSMDDVPMMLSPDTDKSAVALVINPCEELEQVAASKGWHTHRPQ